MQFSSQGAIQLMQPAANQDYQNPIIEQSTHHELQVFSHACSTGHLESVISLSADPHAPSNTYYLNFGLISAIINQQLEVIRYLLSHGAIIDTSITAMAVKAASLPVFEILLSHGWDVNTSFMGGHTALTNLLHNLSLTRWLLSHGADPNLGPPLSPQPDASPLSDSGAVLDTAASIASPEVFALLLQHGAKLQNSLPLHAAAASTSKSDGESIPLMEYLLELGVDINGSDEARGFAALGTPLLYAIRERMIQRVEFLLSKRADVRVTGRGGVTALQLAKQTGREDLIALVEMYSEKD